MTERRRAARVPVQLYVNKYVDGYPYACKLVDLSESGLRIERMSEPEDISQSSAYPIEIGRAGSNDTIWVWAQSVWKRGQQEALRIMHVDPFERLLLLDLLDSPSA